MRCAHCQFDNPAGMRFCGNCGAPFETPPSPPAAGDVAAAAAERRQITVLFCDLVGSTRLAERLDAEQLREVVRDYQALAGQVIEPAEGYVAQYLGDGILVYFGYPQAHEDDARRAVRAGLGILRELVQLSDTVADEYGVTLAARIGIHTGSVVAGEIGAGGRRDQLALGQAPNVAARLQELAGPNEVLLSGDTAQLLRDEFICESRGTQTIRGLSRPFAVYRAVRPRPRRLRETADAAALTPPVGRWRELNALHQGFARVMGGGTAAMLITGEAGVGKSRLVRIFRDAVGESHARWVTLYCSAYTQQSVLYPVAEFLRGLCGDEAVTSTEQLIGLEQVIAGLGLPLPETIPLLAVLMGLPLPPRYDPLELTPPLLRARTDAVLLQILTAMAAGRPVIVLVEDLHWADPSTLQLIDVLLRTGAPGRLMLILTARPGPAFERPWEPQMVEELTVDRLSEADVRWMVTTLCGGKMLPPDVMSAIAAKTDGVPLFVEEFTRMMLESGRLVERSDRFEVDGPIATSAIPATIQDSLVARLDRVQSVKPILQWGAVLGRVFSFDLIQAVSGRPPDALADDLERLVEVGLLQRRGPRPGTEFTFRHALIQDAAYGLLLNRTRRAWHKRAADVLRDRFSEVGEAQPELLARHYGAAGLSELAADYWLLGAQQALSRSAHAEAEAMVDQATLEIEGQPEGFERDRRELTLQTIRASVLSVRDGYIGERLLGAYDRARALAKRLQNEPHRVIGVLAGLVGAHTVRGELVSAGEVGDELLDAAARLGQPQSALEAHRYVALVHHMAGRLAQSREHYEQALAAAACLGSVSTAPTLAEEGRVNVRATFATTLWALGYWDRARALSAEAVALADDMKHSYSVAFANYLAAWLQQLLRQPVEVNRHARRVVALSEQHGFFFIVLGSLNLLWSQVQLSTGTPAENEALRGQLREFRERWNAYLAFGAHGCEIYFTSLLIESHLRLGEADAAGDLLEHCLTLVGPTGDHWEADLYRLKGEMLRDPAVRRRVGGAAADAAAEASFRQAIDIATRQSAMGLKLRAATSLARLLAARGQPAAAIEVLAPVRAWFQEGLDQPELLAADRLLGDLEPGLRRL